MIQKKRKKERKKHLSEMFHPHLKNKNCIYNIHCFMETQTKTNRSTYDQKPKKKVKNKLELNLQVRYIFGLVTRDKYIKIVRDKYKKRFKKKTFLSSTNKIQSNDTDFFLFTFFFFVNKLHFFEYLNLILYA